MAESEHVSAMQPVIAVDVSDRMKSEPMKTCLATMLGGDGAGASWKPKPQTTPACPAFIMFCENEVSVAG